MVCCARCNSESGNNTLCEECESILQNRINIVLEVEFSQTEGYDSKYFVDLPKHYECPLCLAGLRDPVQIAGECGHVFCGSCLNRATPGERKTCPLDRVPFIQTFPDRSKRREVLSLKVTCQNNGCSWKGELSDLLDHTRGNCGRLLLSCLNLDCPEKLCREKIIEHCLECKFSPNIPCTFVQLGCLFEGSRSKVDNHMKTHANEHLSLTIAKINQQENKIIQQDKKIIQQDNKINQQENKIIQQDNKINQQQNKNIHQDKKIIQQDNQINRQQNKNIQQDKKINHQDDKLNEQEDKINQQENKIKEQENKINQQDNKIGELNERLQQQENMTTNKFKELNERFDQILAINKTNDKKQIEIMQEIYNDFKIQNAEISKNNEEYKKEHAELKLKYEELQEKCYYLQSVLLNKDNEFVWKISNYETQFQNAQNKNPREIYSPAFYTSHGYKFKLCACLNGYGIRENTDTSVFSRLLKGVNDDNLEWPFNKKYTLTIVSPNDRVVDKTHPIVPAKQEEVLEQCFIKPTTEGNVDFGAHLLPHTEKQQYIKDDIMIIKCVVDC